MNLQQSLSNFGAALSINATQTNNTGLTSTANLNAEQSLLVYRQNITGARQRVLEIIYPVCCKIVGADCFDTLARDYAWVKNIRRPDLNHFGDEFARLLENIVSQHSAFSGLDYLPDLARLEWYWHRAHFLVINQHENSVDLTQTNAANLKLVINSSLQWMQTPYPVLEIWQQHRLDRQPDSVNMPEIAIHLLTWRHHHNVQVESITPEIARLLELSAGGLTLGVISQDPAILKSGIISQLPDMVEKGWITGFFREGDQI
jgi:hypothetical protein